MGCSCCHRTTEDAEKANDVLGKVGLSDVVEQGREAISATGKALTHLTRSERARSLGFGVEVANVQLDAAKRANQRARDHAQAVLERIDRLVRSDDWGAHVERVRAAFQERGGGRRRLEDACEDLRLQLLNEEPGVSPSVAELTMRAFDRVLDAASKGDLNQMVGHMRRIMEGALHAFESPEMGRQWIGSQMIEDVMRDRGIPPIAGAARDEGWCAAWAACIAWAISSLAACLVICFVWGFCSWHMACFAGESAHILACSLIFGNLCSYGHL